MLDGAVKTHSDILTNVGITTQIFYGLGTLWWGEICLGSGNPAAEEGSGEDCEGCCEQG